jgi:putative hydrolase of the HAD superfamily
MVTGMIDTSSIRNIILDLGGVILDLDIDRTLQAFQNMGFPPLESTDIILSKYPFFLDFETGKISSGEFVDRVIEISGSSISSDNVLSAWNAMIRGFRKENIDLLRSIQDKYRLFLLSNTNAIHEVHYNDQLNKEHGIENLDRLFDKVYYSHDLKMRKPDAEIFSFVLDDAGIMAEECLYVDDTLEHIESARKLGIVCHHLAPPQRLTDIL